VCAKFDAAAINATTRMFDLFACTLLQYMTPIIFRTSGNNESHSDLCRFCDAYARHLGVRRLLCTQLATFLGAIMLVSHALHFFFLQPLGKQARRALSFEHAHSAFAPHKK